MITFIESVLVIFAISATSIFAGRIAAMVATGLAVVGLTVVIPLSDSLEMEDNSDVAILIFQTMVGLAVAYRRPAKTTQSAAAVSLKVKRAVQRTECLRTISQAIVKRDSGLAARLNDLEAYGELAGECVPSCDVLERILSDVLRIAVSDPGMQRVTLFSARRPGLEQIHVVTEYTGTCALPVFHILWRSGSDEPIPMKGWPANCSLSAFKTVQGRLYTILIRSESSKSATFTSEASSRCP